MAKKVFSYTFVLLILLTFAGCSGEEYVSPTVQQSNNIMEALQNDDTEAFKSYLCPGIQDAYPDLDSEIQEFFDFIDGDIVSYDEPGPEPTGGHTTPKGWVEKFFDANIRNIKTSSGMTYHLHYEYYLIYEDHPELLGISYIRITTSDAVYDQKTGYPPDKCRIIRIEE